MSLEDAGVSVCGPSVVVVVVEGPEGKEASLRIVTRGVNICFPSFPSGSRGAAGFPRFIFEKRGRRRKRKGKKGEDKKQRKIPYEITSTWKDLMWSSLSGGIDKGVGVPEHVPHHNRKRDKEEKKGSMLST